MSRSPIALALTALLAACGPAPRTRAQAAPPPGAAPEETRPPNAHGQVPAFAGQTRAPRLTNATRFQVTTLAHGLVHPWSLVFLPDGRMLVSERPGRLRIVGPDGAISVPLAGAPAVASGGQLGLFGLALAPDFATSRQVFMAYAAATPGGSALTVAHARLSEAGGAARLQALTPIFHAEPPRPGTANIGGRLAFAPDGTLFVTVGDRFQSRDLAQRPDSDLGKVVRIARDGAAPQDNPFVGRAGARPEVWSLGHRNPEAAAINPWSRRLWIVEHGARGGDEVNIAQAGRNYGWPVITYGEDYSGAPIGQGTQRAGLEQPIYYWDPVLAPSGMAFYDAGLFPAWRGSLFVGGLGSQHLARLTLKGDRVVGEEWLLGDLGARFRDVAVGPDGAIYLLTDEDDGRILKLTPR